MTLPNDNKPSLILHGYYRSSASFRVRITLNLKGVAYENIAHHLRKDEQYQADYLAINPVGLVPAVIDGPNILTQSLAIIEYLDETIPAPALLPHSAGDRAYVRALAQNIASDIHPIDNLRVLKYLRQTIGLDQEAVSQWYNHWIATGFAALEQTLSRDSRTGKFCFGDTPSLADIVLAPQVVNAATFALDLTPYPTIRRIFDTCMALPAFANAHPSRQPDAE